MCKNWEILGRRGQLVNFIREGYGSLFFVSISILSLVVEVSNTSCVSTSVGGFLLP